MFYIVFLLLLNVWHDICFYEDERQRFTGKTKYIATCKTVDQRKDCET